MTTALRGSLPALVTPLTPERELAEGDLATLVTRALDDGAVGVLVAGSTGEGTLLEPEQRVQATRTARHAIDEAGSAGAPATVVASAVGLTVGALDADVARLTEAGADAALVLAPHTYGLRPEELIDLHQSVAERATVPTLIYHIPQLTGSSLTSEAVAELATHPNIAGMKDSSADADRRAAFVTATADRPDFDVLTGHGPTLRAALEAGVAGSITAIANVRQRRVVALHEAVTIGQADRAGQLQRSLTRTWEAMESVGASMPAVLKAALQFDGLIAERWCRPPLRSIGPARLDRVRTALMS